jgi:hypothetical protein
MHGLINQSIVASCLIVLTLAIIVKHNEKMFVSLFNWSSWKSKITTNEFEINSK